MVMSRDPPLLLIWRPRTAQLAIRAPRRDEQSKKQKRDEAAAKAAEQAAMRAVDRPRQQCRFVVEQVGHGLHRSDVQH